LAVARENGTDTAQGCGDSPAFARGVFAVCGDPGILDGPRNGAPLRRRLRSRPPPRSFLPVAKHVGWIEERRSRQDTACHGRAKARGENRSRRLGWQWSAFSRPRAHSAMGEVSRGRKNADGGDRLCERCENGARGLVSGSGWRAEFRMAWSGLGWSAKRNR